MTAAVFIVAALLAGIGALGVVLSRNPVHSALFLIQTLFGVALLFVLQDAHFLAAVQVIVYAGAIVILFLFVIMLLGVDKAEDLRLEPLAGQRPLAALIGVAIAGVALTVVVAAGDVLSGLPSSSVERSLSSDVSDIERLGRVLFSEYALAVEITAVLLTIAVISAVVLTRRLDGQAPPLPDPASFEPADLAPAGADEEPSVDHASGHGS